MQHEMIPVVPQVNLGYLDKMGTQGPVAWHATCSRYHARRADCGLVSGTFISKAGNETPVLRHSKARKKSTAKIKARKS